MAYKLNQWPRKDDQADSTEGSQANEGDIMNQDDQATQSPTENKDSSPLTIPVEPMTSPPDIVYPFPSTPSPKSPDVPANFSTKLNRVAKMRTGPMYYKAKLVNALTTRPRVILHRLPIQDIKIHFDTI